MFLKKPEYNNWIIVSIVAIVALVGMIVITSNLISNNSSESDVAGKAIISTTANQKMTPYEKFALNEISNYQENMRTQGIDPKNYLVIRKSTQGKLIRGELYSIPRSAVKKKTIILSELTLNSIVKDAADNGKSLTEEEQNTYNNLLRDARNNKPIYTEALYVDQENIDTITANIGSGNIGSDGRMYISACTVMDDGTTNARHCDRSFIGFCVSSSSMFANK